MSRSTRIIVYVVVGVLALFALMFVIFGVGTGGGGPVGG